MLNPGNLQNNTFKKLIAFPLAFLSPCIILKTARRNQVALAITCLEIFLARLSCSFYTLSTFHVTASDGVVLCHYRTRALLHPVHIMFGALICRHSHPSICLSTYLLTYVQVT